MSVESDELLRILRIGQDVSIRGRGLSMRDAIRASKYGSLRGSFGPADLLPLLKANPNLVEQWLMYSEDKRTSGGFWVLSDPPEVGSLGAPDWSLRFRSIEEAVAAFVIEEIEYWFGVGQQQGYQ